MLAGVCCRRSASYLHNLVPVTVGLLLAPSVAGASSVQSQSQGQCSRDSPQCSSTRSFHTSSTRMAAAGKTYVVEPKGQHTASLIFLHGLGDNGQGWSVGLASLNADNTRIVCPTAPNQPVTINMGMRMPSWFDIYGLGVEAKQDDEGVKKASLVLKELISEEEKRGIPRDHIIIGGFSQGGVVALYTALTLEGSPLGGLIACSTWLPMHQTIGTQVTEAGRNIPIVQCHGARDAMVPIVVGQMTGAALSGIVKQHELKVFPDLQHSSSPQELQYVESWLKKRIAKL